MHLCFYCLSIKSIHKSNFYWMQCQASYLSALYLKVYKSSCFFVFFLVAVLCCVKGRKHVSLFRSSFRAQSLFRAPQLNRCAKRFLLTEENALPRKMFQQAINKFCKLTQGIYWCKWWSCSLSKIKLWYISWKSRVRGTNDHTKLLEI